MRQRRRLAVVGAVVGMGLAACADGGGTPAVAPTGVPASPTASESPTPAVSPSDTTAPSPTPGEEPGAVEVRVVDGQVEGPGRVTVMAGEAVMLRVTSDVADEIHVHGYDISTVVAAGEPTTIHFVADIPGVFEVELEERHLKLLELEVQP